MLHPSASGTSSFSSGRSSSLASLTALSRAASVVTARNWSAALMRDSAAADSSPPSPPNPLAPSPSPPSPSPPSTSPPSSPPVPPSCALARPSAPVPLGMPSSTTPPPAGTGCGGSSALDPSAVEGGGSSRAGWAATAGAGRGVGGVISSFGSLRRGSDGTRRYERAVTMQSCASGDSTGVRRLVAELPLARGATAAEAARLSMRASGCIGTKLAAWAGLLVWRHACSRRRRAVAGWRGVSNHSFANATSA